MYNNEEARNAMGSTEECALTQYLVRKAYLQVRFSSDAMKGSEITSLHMSCAQKCTQEVTIEEALPTVNP